MINNLSNFFIQGTSVQKVTINPNSTTYKVLHVQYFFTTTSQKRLPPYVTNSHNYSMRRSNLRTLDIDHAKPTIVFTLHVLSQWASCCVHLLYLFYNHLSEIKFLALTPVSMTHFVGSQITTESRLVNPGGQTYLILKIISPPLQPVTLPSTFSAKDDQTR